MPASSHWNTVWSERPVEEASNFNPAFCGELLCRTVGEYYKARRAPLNVAVAFVVLPLTLHKQTRDHLPGRANTAFAGWIADHNTLLAELPLRIERLRPVVREALLFTIRHSRLALRDGGLVPGGKPLSLSAKSDVSTDDTDEARSASHMLGRWFAAQGSQPALLQGFGVLP